MIKVFQKVVDAEKGDCLSACIASLFELKLEEVPNFFYPYEKEEQEYETHFWQRFIRYIRDKFGIEYFYMKSNPNDPRYLLIEKPEIFEDQFPQIKEHIGINELFLASVYSPKYRKQNKTHSVIIDKDFNIIHDPNPNYQNIKKYPFADEIGYNGIVDIIFFEGK